jgi:flagellar motor switch/type III secretory pathway protein FliN
MVKGGVVGIGVLLLVRVGLTVSDTVGVIERVNGQVVAIGDGLTDPVTERVNGQVVAIGEPLLVNEFDRVRLTDVVGDMVPDAH